MSLENKLQSKTIFQFCISAHLLYILYLFLKSPEKNDNSCAQLVFTVHLCMVTLAGGILEKVALLVTYKMTNQLLKITCRYCIDLHRTYFKTGK